MQRVPFEANWRYWISLKRLGELKRALVVLSVPRHACMHGWVSRTTTSLWAEMGGPERWKGDEELCICCEDPDKYEEALAGLVRSLFRFFMSEL